MKTIVLTSCVKSKRAQRSKARDLYTSALFTKQLHYAESLAPDAIYILSAKYGLLELDEEVEPYELTLKTMTTVERQRWAAGVLERLSIVADLQSDRFIILAGVDYNKYLIPRLAHVELPLEGLSIGRRLQFLAVHEGAGNA